MVYKWKSGYRPKADAQKVGQELERLRQRLGGRLTAPEVVRAAVSRNSAMHPLFEWNDKKAAEQHRLEQARGIVRSVVVELRGEESQEGTEIRAFVSYMPDEQPVGAREVYTDVRGAMADPVIRGQILRRAMDELLRWKARYEHLRDFWGVVEAIEAVAISPVAQIAEEQVTA